MAYHQVSLKNAIHQNENSINIFIAGDCFIDYNKTAICPKHRCNGMCWSNHTRCQVQCGEYRNEVPFISIENYMKLKNKIDQQEARYEEIQVIDYICNFRKCNSPNNSDALQRAVEQYFNLSILRNISQHAYSEMATSKPIQSTMIEHQPTLNIITSSTQKTTDPRSSTCSDHRWRTFSFSSSEMESVRPASTVTKIICFF